MRNVSLRIVAGKKFISEGPSMKIIFTTDEDRNQLGFEARYRIVQNAKVCEYRMTKSGTILI